MEIRTDIANFIDVMDFFLHPMRDDGKMLRASSFEPEYNAVERPAGGRFITTVEKSENPEAIKKPELPESPELSDAEQKTGSFGEKAIAIALGARTQPPAAAKTHIFLLHGGACVLEAMKHGFVMKELADRGFRVSAFDYPLAPEHQYDEINEATYAAYNDLIKWYPDDEIALFGDSSGGTLALELLFRLKDENRALPEKIILPCPYSDWSVSNPELDEYLPNDPGLPKACLLVSAEFFGGGADLKDPKVSPYYAEDRYFEDLGEVLFIYSTGDGLVPDIEKLAGKMASAAGTEVQIHKCEGLYHDYILDVDLPESQEALDRIAEFLK